MVDRSMARVLGLGFVSGLRSMAGPALLARHLKENPPDEWPHPLLRLWGQDPGASLVQLFAGGEIVGDKLPFVPARTDPAPLAGRAASGAAVGAALNALEGRPALAGALLGGAAAVVGATVGYHVRRALTSENGLPDVAVALAEDAVTLAIGSRVLGM